MNKVILMGRLVREPEIRFAQSSGKPVARYTLAVDRRYAKDGDQDADFPTCVVFGKAAEFAEKYFHKGTKIILTGRLQTGSYTKDDGTRVYTTEVIVEDQEFAESKSASSHNSKQREHSKGQASDEDGFEEIDDEDELPF
jgi:single-strand DNA-binding protein